MKKTSTIAGLALALGLSTSILVPGTAQAAGLPDLVVGTLYFTSIGQAESASIPVVVKNNGTGPSSGADVVINIGNGLPLLSPVNDANWRCSAPVRSNSDNSTTVKCTTPFEIGPGESLKFALKVRGEPDKDDTVALAMRVDYTDSIDESNENNNTNVSTY